MHFIYLAGIQKKNEYLVLLIQAVGMKEEIQGPVRTAEIIYYFLVQMILLKVLLPADALLEQDIRAGDIFWTVQLYRILDLVFHLVLEQ